MAAAVLAVGLVPVMILTSAAADPAPTAVPAQPRALQQMTILPAAFVPETDSTPYFNYGGVVTAPSGGSFQAQAPFAQTVVIKQLTLYAWDEGAGAVCLTLWRDDPAIGNSTSMAKVCSTGAKPGVRTFTTSVPASRRVLAGHGARLTASLHAGSSYHFFGARLVFGT